jgi:3-isopropylmalate dehydrogenase
MSGTGGPGDGAPLAFSVVVLPGDGIGAEVTAAARRVAETVGEGGGASFAWDVRQIGGAAIDAYGEALRDQDLAACQAADAVLLGAVGGPRWDDPSSPVRPEQALFKLRKGLGLFANLRPITLQPALLEASPLREERLRGVDLLILRELTGGLYFGERREAAPSSGGRDERSALDTLPYAEGEIRRIVTLAFELAAGRRRSVTSVDKANVLATSRLWRTVAEDVGREHPDVRLEHRLVDSFAMQLITQPAAFDVVVTENLFGDILSDEASVLTGSLGMLPSASLGDRETAHGRFGMYEPVHGSAPDIAGTGMANPLGAILSLAMLLRWSLGRGDLADRIEGAVRAALSDGYRTRDLAGLEASPGVQVVGTDEMTAAVIDRLDGARAAHSVHPHLELVR